MSRIDRIEIHPESGIIQVRVRKTVVVQGSNEEIDVGFHRMVLVPGDDYEAVLAANLSDLRDNHKAADIAPEDLLQLEAHRRTEHTPEKVAAFRELAKQKAVERKIAESK